MVLYNKVAVDKFLRRRKIKTMMYHMTLADETEIVHSHLKEEENEQKIVLVHFERPKFGGFDSARISLPFVSMDNERWIHRRRNQRI